MKDRKTTRLAAVLAVVTGLLLAFAALGGVGMAQAGGGPGKGQYGKKVTICHKGKKTIRVSKAAVRKHLKHGDTIGRCDRAGKKGKGHKGHKGDKGHKGQKGSEAKKGAEKGSKGDKGSKGENPGGKSKKNGKG
jgi:hypothetical protein